MDKKDMADLKRIDAVFSVFKSNASEEFVSAFKKLVEYVRGLHKQALEEIGAVAEKMAREFKDLKEQLEEEVQTAITHLSEKEQELVDSIDRALNEKLTSLEYKMISRVDTYLRKTKNGRDGRDGARGKDGVGIQGPQGKQGIQGPPGSADTADNIRNKLELLTGDDRLDKKAIRGLDELEKKIDSLASKKEAPHSFAVQRGAVRAYDLSAKLDGSTKTFLLPAFWRVISVHLSSTPGILRPTTDYTTDASISTITFTSEINAASSLSTGQTLIIVYAEP